MLSIKNLKTFIGSIWSEHRWALIAGILTGTSYIPFWPWAALFNFAPLWWYWLFKARNRRQVFWSGWITQFVFNLIGFHWVYHTAHEFGHFPALLSGLVLLLFASLAHLYVPLVGVLFFAVRERLQNRVVSRVGDLALLLFLIGLWGLAEIFWPYLFQWHMGYTLLWAKLPLYHWADVIGFQGLAFVLLLFNGFFVWWSRRSRSQSPALHWATAGTMAAVVFAVLNLLGWQHGKNWIASENDKQIEFLAVQANIGNTEKIMAERGMGYQDFILERFIAISQKALQENPTAPVLVWPESAIPDYLDQIYNGRRRPQRLKAFLKQTQKSLITGAYSKEVTGSPQESAFNALFVLNAEGDVVVPPYRKKHLLAFGEYTPMGEWFPVLNEISPSGKGFSRGPGPRTLLLQGEPFRSLRIAPQICYEALYPDFSREGVLQGAQILINLTNDSWFGARSEPYQHLSMTFARAIENRRPLLRVTNTGFTSAINASGEILTISPLYEEWFRSFSLAYQENPPLTLYSRYGDLWALVVVLVTFTALVVAFRQKKSPTRAED